jgi:hypothetical protein
MTTSTIIYGSDGSVEITVYDDNGNSIQRLYGTVEGEQFHGDLDRFGWDGERDEFTIGGASPG